MGSVADDHVGRGEVVGPSLVGCAAAQLNATRTDSTPAPTIVDIAGVRLGCPPANGPSMLTPTNELGTCGTAAPDRRGARGRGRGGRDHKPERADRHRQSDDSG